MASAVTTDDWARRFPGLNHGYYTSITMVDSLEPHNQVIWRDVAQMCLPQIPMRDPRYHLGITWFKYNHSYHPNAVHVIGVQNHNRYQGRVFASVVDEATQTDYICKECGNLMQRTSAWDYISLVLCGRCMNPMDV